MSIPIKQQNQNELEIKENLNKKGLTPKQELFCQLFVNDKNCFNNATKSYTKAYHLDVSGGDEVARTNASRLLTKNNIKRRIRKLLSILINDAVVDRELAFTIMQRRNLHAKVQAIKEYNKLKRRTALNIETEDSLTKLLLKIQNEKRPIVKDSSGEPLD